MFANLVIYVRQRKVFTTPPERRERCLNYTKVYQGEPAWPIMEGVPVGLCVKTMLCAPSHWSEVMNLSLPDDVNAFVKSLVSDGRFDSEEAAIIEGVRMLMGREQLKAEIQIGIDQLDNGNHFDEEPAITSTCFD